MRRIRKWAKTLKLELQALAIATQDPRTPRIARLLMLLTVAYALSPIDLIPDAIPVLGLLDDLILVPFGIWLALKATPACVIEEARARVRSQEVFAGTGWLQKAGLAIVIFLWILGFVTAVAIFFY
mgnify:CR=1 FL=1